MFGEIKHPKIAVLKFAESTHVGKEGRQRTKRVILIEKPHKVTTHP